jgi:uroporphyrinogen-III synthase
MRDRMNKNKLKGIKILITRPIEEAKELEQSFFPYGADTLVFPCINIIPLNFCMPKFRVDGYIFTSKNAVNFFFQKSDCYNYIQRVNKIYAVGRSTAKAIEKYYNIKVVYPKFRGSAELLRVFTEEELVKNKNYLIIQGENGKPLLKEGLRKLGAYVSDINCYYRQIPSSIYTERIIKIDNEIDNATLDLIIFSSFEALKNAWNMLMKQDLLLRSAITVTNYQMLKWAQEKGFSKILYLDDLSNNGIVKQVIDFYK